VSRPKAEDDWLATTRSTQSTSERKEAMIPRLSGVPEGLRSGAKRYSPTAPVSPSSMSSGLPK
jgi:hypothetical protein